MKSFLDKLNEEVVKSDGSDQLDEGLRDIAAKIKEKLQGFLGQAKIFVKKIRGKIFPFYKKGREVGVIDMPTRQVAAKWAGSKNHMTFMINPKVVGPSAKAAPKAESVEENPDTIFGKLLSEVKTKAEIEKSAMGALGDIGMEIQDVDDADDDATEGIGEAKVDYEDLAIILEEATLGLKFRTNYDERVPSIMIMGPPGAGKTTVIKQFAKQEGFNLKIVEVASLYKEVLGGFPIVEKVLAEPNSEEAKKLASIRKKDKGDLSKADQEFMAKFGDEFSDYVVNLKSTTALPPNKGAGKWILFLDEFNRDSDKMGAAMNMVLTGNIGTSYFLPLKTMVVASGNVGGEFDKTHVQDMDTATWDRFGRRVLLTYDWLGWLKYSETEFDEMNMGKSPAVIRNFVARTTKEKGENDWTIDLKQFNPDSDAMLTPRTMSELSQQMMLAAKNDWERDKLVGKNDKAWYEERYEDKGFPSPEAYYLHVNQLNRHLMGRVADQLFGPEAGDTVVDMLRGFNKTKEEAVSFSADDVLYKWTKVREDMKDKIRPQLVNEFAVKLPDLLAKFKTKASFKKALSGAGVDAKKDLEKVKGDVAVWAAVNIHNFLKDSELGMDTAGGVAKELADLRGVADVDTPEEGEGKKPVKLELLDEVLAFLIKKSDVFGQAWATIADAVEDEADGTSEFKTAMALARKGELLTGEPPKYIVQNLDGEQLKDYLFITNMQMMEPGIVRRLRLDKEKEQEQVEEAMKNLFKRL